MLGLREETNIPKNSKAIIMLATLKSVYCITMALKMIRQYFYHVTARNVKFAVNQ